MQVVWSNRAIADLVEIQKYIIADDPAEALRVVARIREAVSNLERFPRLAPKRGDGYVLAIPDKKFVVLYRIRGEKVRILRVLRGRRDRSDFVKN